MQHVRIIWACSLLGAERFKQKNLLKISVPGGQKKLLDRGLLGGISAQADTMPNVTI